MAKEVAAFIKLQIKGGAANPSPPVGPALGSKGVNIMDFCKQFNARTQDKAGKVLPVIITVYGDKSFDFVIKQPPVAVQLKETFPRNLFHDSVLLLTVSWYRVILVMMDGNGHSPIGSLGLLYFRCTRKNAEKIPTLQKEKSTNSVHYRERLCRSRNHYNFGV